MSLTIEMPGMNNAIVLLLPLIADESDCDGLSEGVLDHWICALFGILCFLIVHYSRIITHKAHSGVCLTIVLELAVYT